MRRQYFGEDIDVIGTNTKPTTDLGPLFSSSIEVHEAQEAGIQAAFDHANVRWRKLAYAAVVQVARTHALFTTDEIWAELDKSVATTHEPAALGPILRIAFHDGLCAKSGEMVKTKLKRRHRLLTQWRSLVLDKAS